MNKNVVMTTVLIVVLIVGVAAYLFSVNKQPSQVAPGQEQNQNVGQADQAKEIIITAKQFSFEPSEITVNQGERIRLVIASMDVPHGFAIDEYGIKETVEPGKVLAIDFMADKSGEFKFYCSLFCGEGHRNMTGKLIVK